MQHSVEEVASDDGSQVLAVVVRFILPVAVASVADLDLRVEAKAEGQGCFLVLRGVPGCREQRVRLKHEVEEDSVRAKYKQKSRSLMVSLAVVSCRDSLTPNAPAPPTSSFPQHQDLESAPARTAAEVPASAATPHALPANKRYEPSVHKPRPGQHARDPRLVAREENQALQKVVAAVPNPVATAPAAPQEQAKSSRHRLSSENSQGNDPEHVWQEDFLSSGPPSLLKIANDAGCFGRHIVATRAVAAAGEMLLLEEPLALLKPGATVPGCPEQSDEWLLTHELLAQGKRKTWALKYVTAKRAESVEQTPAVSWLAAEFGCSESDVLAVFRAVANNAFSLDSAGRNSHKSAASDFP